MNTLIRSQKVAGRVGILPILLLVGAFIIGGAAWFFVFRAERSIINPSKKTNTATVQTSNENTARVIPPSPTQAADADRDGLTDEEESAAGTKVDNADSDDDGLSDLAEVKTYKSNPLVADSDGDGKRDGEEVKAGLDPNGPGTLLDIEKAIEALNASAE
jgi:cytoskeletal protein RodZ